ncbi:MAG: hypothetical protein QM751_05105 [Paludibacteraceae bacterium]
MPLTKVLISVKTYPSLSEKYDELVCTAGFREDGSWIRIYPVPFRKLDYSKRYHKWEWIEMNLVNNDSDFRPESYRPYSIDGEIKTIGEVGTSQNWKERKHFSFKKVHTNLSELIDEAKNPHLRTSLAVVKPKKIIDFIWEEVEREWPKNKLNSIKGNQMQGCLFDEKDTEEMFKVVEKIPYKFSYVFTTEDDVKRTIMIEDWELGVLYLNCLKRANGNEKETCQKVKEKYFDYMTSKCDLYFFMGTTLKFHNVAPNPFIIIGVFYPPKTKEKDTLQLSMF